MKAVKIAVLNGGKVSQVLEIEASRTAPNAIVRAAKGTRFVVMGSNDEPVPQPILARRFGRNLFVDLDQEGGDLPLLIIEDFHAMQAELIGKHADGTYHAYVQQRGADLDAADLLDGGDAELVLAADTLAGSGTLGESLTDAGAGAGAGAGGATAGLGGVALAVLAGLGPAGINAVLANDRKQAGTGADVTRPDKATVLVGVHDDVGTQQGRIEAGDITDDRTPSFNGRGTPGITVEILDGGTLIGKTVVQADGHWKWTPAEPLAEGAHSMTFREVDGAGTVSPGSQGFDFVVDITTPGKWERGGGLSPQKEAVSGLIAAQGNEGIDNLQEGHGNQILDTVALAGKLSSENIIDLTGTDGDKVMLSLADVLTYASKDLFIADSTTQMMIKGDTSDIVGLSDLLDGVDSGDWAQHAGTVMVEGAQYAVYVHSVSNAELLVQSGVQVHLDNH